MLSHLDRMVEGRHAFPILDGGIGSIVQQQLNNVSPAGSRGLDQGGETLSGLQINGNMGIEQYFDRLRRS